MDMVQRGFENFLLRHNVHKNSKVIVALSGGSDSVCALHLSQLYFKSVIALHVNYGLRGQESDSEEEYCRQLCNKMRVPLFVKRVSPEERQGGSQSKYRDIRYNFFSNIFEKEKCNYLIVGHHKNDQSETIFMNLVKGAGVIGLSGIRPITTNFGMNIVRPLLDVTKKEIIQYLDNHGIEYKTDSSNHKNDYARNKIRNQILPSIDEELGTNLTEVLDRLGKQMFDIQEMFESYNQQIRKKHIKRYSDSIELSFDEIVADYHPTIIKNFIHSLLKSEFNIRQIQSVYVEDVFKLLHLESGSEIHLPNKLLATRKKNKIVFSFRVKTEPLNFKIKVEIGKKARIEQLGIELHVLEKSETEDMNENNPNQEIKMIWVSPDSRDIEITSYEEGSKVIFAEDKHKKLKKIIKEKSDIELSSVWYIKDDGEPVYIPCVEYQVKSPNKTKKLILKLRPL